LVIHVRVFPVFCVVVSFMHMFSYVFCLCCHSIAVSSSGNSNNKSGYGRIVHL
jgi:hypothetical protein